MVFIFEVLICLRKVDTTGEEIVKARISKQKKSHIVIKSKLCELFFSKRKYGRRKRTKQQ